MGKLVRLKAKHRAVVQAGRAWAEFRERSAGSVCPDLTPSIGEQAMAQLVEEHGEAAGWERFLARAFDAHLARTQPALSREERFVLVGSMPMFLAFLAADGRVPPEVVDRAFADCDAIDPWR
jgi:hypothetical protein